MFRIVNQLTGFCAVRVFAGRYAACSAVILFDFRVRRFSLGAQFSADFRVNHP